LFDGQARDALKQMARREPLDKMLFEEPYRFEFFQAVRLLERLDKERTGVGMSPVPEKEVVRFTSNAALNFPPSEINGFKDVVDEESGEKRLEMSVNFMGMLGIAGVLPIHYSELVIERRKYGDRSLHAFLDIFSHRMVSYFFKAWEKYRFPIQYERGGDDFTQYLFDWIGLGTKGLRNRMGLEEERLLPYGGLIQQNPHSAIALEQLLADYYAIPSEVLEFFGQWLNLDEKSITRLGQSNSILGSEAIIGSRVWDQQSKFRMVLGPMPFSQFLDMLPNGSAHEPLKSMTTFMVGLELDFDIQLRLLAQEVPGCVLTTRAKRKPMLGWTSWLKSLPFEKDDDQVVLQVAEELTVGTA